MNKMVSLSEVVRREGKEGRTGKESQNEVAFNGLDESHSEVEEREESKGADHDRPTTVHLQRREAGTVSEKETIELTRTTGEKNCSPLPAAPSRAS